MNQTFTPPICAVNPVVGSMKRLGRSPLFLWICILQTAAAGLTLLSSLGTFIGFASLLDLNGLEYTAGSSVLSCVVPGLFAMGLWLIRRACCSDISPFVTTGGLKTVKVLVTISLAFLYIVAGCIPLFLLGLLLAGSAMGDLFSDPSFYGEFHEEFLDEFSQTPGFSIEEIPIDEMLAGGLLIGLVIVLVTVLAVMVYFILYYHFLRRGISTLMENAEGILTDRSFPLFTIVTFYIAGGCTAVSALTSLVIFPLAALGSAAMAIVYILGGIIMGRYRKEMQYLRMVSSAPVSPAVPFANEQPVVPAPAAEQPVAAAVSDSQFVPVYEQAAPVIEAEPMANPISAPDEYCSGCGRKRGENENFCPGCGKPFSN